MAFKRLGKSNKPPVSKQLPLLGYQLSTFVKARGSEGLRGRRIERILACLPPPFQQRAKDSWAAEGEDEDEEVELPLRRDIIISNKMQNA